MELGGNTIGKLLRAKKLLQFSLNSWYSLDRYVGDPFFYDSIFSPGGKEAAGPMPPWGVVTMFTAFAELEYDYLVEHESRSLKVNAFFGFFPVFL